MATRIESQQALEALYTVLSVGEKHKTRLSEMSDVTGIGESILRRSVEQLETLGIMQRESGFEQGRRGMISHWTLLKPLDEARSLVAGLSDKKEPLAASVKRRQQRQKQMKDTQPQAATPSRGNGDRRPGKITVTIANREDEILRAVAGPDREDAWKQALSLLRKDESYALLAAATQYRDRQLELKKRLRELEELGITLQVSPEEAFGFTIDERLDTVSLVLPYVEQLERYSARWANRVNESEAEVKELKRTVEGLRREIIRLESRPLVARLTSE